MCVFTLRNSTKTILITRIQFAKGKLNSCYENSLFIYFTLTFSLRLPCVSEVDASESQEIYEIYFLITLVYV